MAIADDIRADIQGVINQPWDVRDGQVVPETDDIALAGGGVNLDATVLYADLVDSTALAMWNRRIASKVIKAFLSASTRLIRHHNGHIRSFDGDRVMGVFLGDYKNTNAAKCALRVNWMFLNVLKPKFAAQYGDFQNGTYKLAHCTGIDTSTTLAVRAGIRNNNDLMWVGRAPNVAAKLSALREAPYYSFMSREVYNKLNDEAKMHNGQMMWEPRTWPSGPIKDVHRSSWTWSP